MRKIGDKKAVSPVISTVLLVMIVITLASIIIFWSKGFIKESLTKEVGGQEKEINQVCSEITAAAIINNDGSFGISNNGNVPIYALNLKVTKNDGGSSITSIIDSVNPGQSIMINEDVEHDDDNYIGIKIIPVIIGTSKSSGEYKEFTCPEGNGVVIK